MNEIGKDMSRIFLHVERFKCLCEYASPINIKDLWYRMYKYSFKQHDINKGEDNPLVCISFIRLLGEIYINVTVEKNSVCAIMQPLFEEFLSKNVWNTFIYHLKSSEDKYLIWSLIKSFSIILYACNASTFSERARELLNSLKENLFVDKSINILDFFSTLVDFKLKPSTAESQMASCKQMVPSNPISFTDLFQSLCGLLSEYWPSFVKQFHDATTSKTEMQSLNRFLILWQKLVEKLQERPLFHAFLKEQFVIAFLSNAYHLNVVSLRIYADIIMQFFISILKSKPLGQSSKFKSLDAAVTQAINSDFFNLLPRDIQISGFGILTNMNHRGSAAKSERTSFQKCDSVIVKKVAFIFLSLIADGKDKKLLFTFVPSVLDFVKQNFDILPEADVHTWMMEIFIDQDDILLGVMFVLLRIYAVLLEGNTEDIHLPNFLNPHSMFISFLQRIGFDHNELLSFLISDETCFLPYLLQYLKLLLKDCDTFMKAHGNLIKLDVFEDSASNGAPPPAKKLLVSYSSSSSEEDLQTDRSLKDRKQCTTFGSNPQVIDTLIKLRHAIQKLVDVDEFPYNVSPLTALLRACEDHFLSL